jgi:small redox-active disulfide protein 2
MSDITQIRVGDGKVGLVGLPEILDQVRSEGLASDDAISDRLLELVSQRNYVAPSKCMEYAAALLREYRKFLGEEVPPEEGGILEIRILGPGCPNCERLMHEVRDVLQEQNVDADLEHVRDLKEIARYGFVATPALVINGRIAASGRVPQRAKIIEWIKEVGT